MSFRKLHLDEIPVIHDFVDGLVWLPVRHHLGIQSFGTNAYSAADAGGLVVEPHDEDEFEELYVVLHGAARFEIDGDAIDAPQGTLVFLHDPSNRREAVATEDGTIVMAFGGMPGAAGPISAWEWTFAASPHVEKGDFDAAYATTARALEDRPDDGNTHFNLACWAARGGKPDLAFEHLRTALANEPKARKWMAEDSDLDAIRDDPRFAELLG